MNIQQNIPLAPLTTIKLGGNASQYVLCTTNEDIVGALQYAKANSLRVHILGGGSNTIFADTGFNGLIIHIQTKGITLQEDTDTVLLAANAGENWDSVVQYAIAHEVSGIECLSGIPGSCGATPFQNVGAYGQEVAETIEHVGAIDRATLGNISFTNADCNFAYRTSRFKTTDRDKYIITSVSFRLVKNGTPAAKYPELAALVANKPINLASVRDAVLTLRKKKSMVIDLNDSNSVSCGSFFTNPIITVSLLNETQRTTTDQMPNYPAGHMDDGTPLVKLSAAWLVEHAGFTKGTRRGNVGISDNHSLALINRGGTTQEILVLAEEIQGAVEAKFGIRLELEPVVV